MPTVSTGKTNTGAVQMLKTKQNRAISAWRQSFQAQMALLQLNSPVFKLADTITDVHIGKSESPGMH